MQLQDLITAQYRSVLHDAHDDGDFGRSGHMHAQPVLRLAKYLKARNCIDYGSGMGTLKAVLDCFNFPCTEFDPGVPGKDDIPFGSFDLLVCTDVLEHIEPDKLDNVLAHQFEITRRGAYFKIGKAIAKRTLSDGRNAHLILKDTRWWRWKLVDVGWQRMQIVEDVPKYVIIRCSK